MAAECDAIAEGKLYVGNYAAAQDADLLDRHNVTHVISAGFRVGHFSTASSAPTSSRYRYLCVDVRDDPNENLLRHLPRATAFIQKALGGDGGGCVFVHCVHGQSRSCAIVVAYLMRMCWEQSDQSSDNDDPKSLLHRCYHQVEAARPCMAINPGFVQQLELYRRMICCDSGCGSSSIRHALTPPMSRAHAAFRSFRARSEYVESGRISKWFPLSAFDGDVVVHEIYRCSKCRHVLFCRSNIVDELTNEDVSALPKSDYWAESAGGVEYSRASRSVTTNLRGGTLRLTGTSTAPDPCASTLKVEPVDWMQSQMEAKRRGKLTCPQCTSKIGSWDWGGVDAWSSIFIAPSKVDQL
jgi:dual specificity phosphatase 12